MGGALMVINPASPRLRRASPRVRRVEGGYRVEEVVTPQGHYIVWPELFATKEAALKAAHTPRRRNISRRDPSKRGKKSGILVHRQRGAMIATGTYDTGINMPPFQYVEATARKGGLMLIAYGAYNAYGLIGPEKGGVALVNEEAHDVVGTLDIPYKPFRRMEVLQDIYASNDWVASAERWGFGMRYKPNPGWSHRLTRKIAGNWTRSEPYTAAKATEMAHFVRESGIGGELEVKTMRQPDGKWVVLWRVRKSKRNPGAKWHMEHADEARELARSSKIPSNKHYFQGKEAAHLESWGSSSNRPGMRKVNPTRPWEAAAVRNPRKASSDAKLGGSYRAFHFDSPDRAYKVQAPASFPRKLWMLGKLHKVYGTDGRLMLSGGILAAGAFGKAPLFILNAKSHGAPARFTARQTEYVPQRASKLHGSVYYHEHSRRSPVTVTRVAPSYYKVAGGGLRITRRGIVG